MANPTAAGEKLVSARAPFLGTNRVTHQGVLGTDTTDEILTTDDGDYLLIAIGSQAIYSHMAGTAGEETVPTARALK